MSEYEFDAPGRGRRPAPSQVYVEPMSTYAPEDDADWTNSAYIDVFPPERRATEHADRWPFARWFVLIFASLLCACGIALSVLGAKNDTRKGVYGGAVIAAAGAVGILSVRTSKRTPVTTTVFAALMIVVAVILCYPAMIFLQLPSSGLLDDEVLGALWKHVVVERPDIICTLESSLKCSGFSKERCCAAGSTSNADASAHYCFLEDSDGTTFDPLRPSVVITWPKEWCPSGCRDTHNAAVQSPCATPLKILARGYSSGISTILFLCVALFSFVGILSCVRVRGVDRH